MRPVKRGHSNTLGWFPLIKKSKGRPYLEEVVAVLQQNSKGKGSMPVLIYAAVVVRECCGRVCVDQILVCEPCRHQQQQLRNKKQLYAAAQYPN